MVTLGTFSKRIVATENMTLKATAKENEFIKKNVFFLSEKNIFFFRDEDAIKFQLYVYFSSSFFQIPVLSQIKFDCLEIRLHSSRFFFFICTRTFFSLTYSIRYDKPPPVERLQYIYTR